jgi:site-specific DNA-cytosine methylase
VVQLAVQYPEQLPLTAYLKAFDVWPQDVQALKAEHLAQVQQWGKPCMLWAGWECQDLSPAGSGKGLAGKRSGTFWALYEVLEQLRKIMGDRPGVRVGEHGHGRLLAEE